ncbi:MAG: glutathione S-transferase family protein [Sphingopyxis sp.]|nr:glutathione S-transferase family protein [Sphingopyxis sp.]
MEPILIYGFPAGSSMGLLAALEWLGKPYRLCRVDMLGEMREPGYARINPRHETPALITDTGAVVTETSAIASWLADRDDERLISFAPRSAEADRMRQLMGFINTGFTGAFSPLWASLEMDPPNPTLQAALRAWGADTVIERHDKLEQMVEDGPYLAGDRRTLADALFIGVARWIDVLEVADKSRWPKLAAVRARLEADPAVIYATALEHAEAVDGPRACLGHVALVEVIERYGA